MDWTRPGQVIAGRFQVERTLGQGGMGVVVEARHRQLGERVALKFLTEERAHRRGAAARLLREARAAARLRSEHVVRVLDVDTLPTGQPFVVMERLEGRDLAAALRREGPLAPERAARLMMQACEAVAEAHAAGIVHRDLKPSNLFLEATPSGERLKVLDFGISKVDEPSADAHLTDSMTLVGSPQYVAPEQIRDPRRVDGRADLWSLGVVLFEMLSGRLPFEAPSSAGLLMVIATEAPAPLPAGLPPELGSVVLRCLEKSPAERFPSALALARQLSSLLPDGPALLARVEAMQRPCAVPLDEPGEPSEITATIDPRPPTADPRPATAAPSARPREPRRPMLRRGLPLLGALLLGGAWAARAARPAPAAPPVAPPEAPFASIASAAAGADVDRASHDASPVPGSAAGSVGSASLALPQAGPAHEASGEPLAPGAAPSAAARRGGKAPARSVASTVATTPPASAPARPAAAPLETAEPRKVVHDRSW